MKPRWILKLDKDLIDIDIEEMGGFFFPAIPVSNCELCNAWKESFPELPSPCWDCNPEMREITIPEYQRRQAERRAWRRARLAESGL